MTRWQCGGLCHFSHVPLYRHCCFCSLCVCGCIGPRPQPCFCYISLVFTRNGLAEMTKSAFIASSILSIDLSQSSFFCLDFCLLTNGSFPMLLNPSCTHGIAHSWFILSVLVSPHENKSDCFKGSGKMNTVPSSPSPPVYCRCNPNCSYEAAIMAPYFAW